MEIHNFFDIISLFCESNPSTIYFPNLKTPRQKLDGFIRFMPYSNFHKVDPLLGIFDLTVETESIAIGDE